MNSPAIERGSGARPPGIAWGEILFRPCVSGDEDRVLNLFNRLSPRSRAMKFFHRTRRVHRRDLPSLKFDGSGDYGILAIKDGECVGMGIWARNSPSHTDAEIAIAVLDEYQGQGIGRSILLSLMRSAARQGINRLVAHVLSENTPVIHLLGPYASRIEHYTADVLLYLVPVRMDQAAFSDG